MVGEPVEQSGGHLGVAEYGRPLAEGQVRRDDDGRPLVEPADEVEEKLAARLGKWEIAQFVHDDEVEPGDEVGQPSLFAATCLRLEPIDEVDDVEEAAACAIADQSTSKGDGQVRLSRGVSQIFVVNGLLTISGEIRAPELWSAPMILNAITEKLKRQSKDDFKGRHFEAWLIVQAVAWYLRYPLSYRDLEEMFRERGFEVDHSTINRWVLAYAPMIEKRLRQFRRPHCGSVRIDETYVKIRGKWRYLYRAIDKHGNPVDFLLTAKRDLDAAKRFFRKMLKDEPLLSPGKIGTDGANTFPSTIKAAVDDGLLHPDPVHYVTKHLQQGIESDHFRVKKNMPKIGGFQSFNTARRTIAGFEAMLWLRKGFGFSGSWNVNDQNDLLAYLFGLQKVNKA